MFLSALLLHLALQLLLLRCAAQNTAVKYVPCPVKSEAAVEDRILHVATCDTRAGWKEFMALKFWNVTSHHLRYPDSASVAVGSSSSTSGGTVVQRTLDMKNVCKGENWGKHGFLTKPLIYLHYIKQLQNIYSDTSAQQHHIILMDSDTFWSADSLRSIWNHYDCARGDKHVVVSTEMSCWIGRYCTAEDLQKWYNASAIATVPSYSPFLNSGVIMGKLQAVADMLQYVITHNQSYYITYKKHKFDDQYAIGDYAIRVAPHLVALDYHQQIAASASIHAPGDPPDEGWPFVCRNRTGGISMSCHIYTNLIRRQGHFSMDKSSCLARRGTWDGLALREELETLAPDPLIWHGNGAGKQAYLGLGHQSFKCFLAKRGMTEQQHQQSYR